jgi:uncharacterized damage-inducible protein DinB
MISQSLLPEFDHEMATTRKVLERIPADKLAWTPHEKSFTMGGLASHLANLINWTPPTMNLDLMDIEPNGVPWKEPGYDSLEAILTAFDAHSKAAREALAGGSDAQFMGNWSLAKNGTILMTMPRIAVIRSFIMNHVVHHRGQLSVYLRLAGAQVPSIYGPSADDPGGM